MIVIMILIVSARWTPYVFCLLIGLQFASTSQTAYLMILEVVSVSNRAVYSTVYNMVTGSLNIWLPLYFKYAPSYAHLYFTNIVLTLLAFVFYLLILPESPRYLVSKRYFYEARRVFMKIAKCNRKPMFSNCFQGES